MNAFFASDKKFPYPVLEWDAVLKRPIFVPNCDFWLAVGLCKAANDVKRDQLSRKP